jgi:hypothetical protein
MRSPLVEEIQGLYGPFTISERLLQRIWFNKDFHLKDLKTQGGANLEILDPGRWNDHEGPDFREAILRIDGRERVGDVEIHFRAADWFHHGHDSDRNYEKVVLHVVLYPEEAMAAGRSSGPESIEALSLLPLLLRDLEEHAMDADLESIEQVDSLGSFDGLLVMDQAERECVLREHAIRRWEQKLHFMRRRMAEKSWSSLCHQLGLEVLGYARNRAPMSRLAEAYPLAAFAAGVDPERLYQSEHPHWKVLGTRPANHPKNRLRQYAALCRASPDWPLKLRDILDSAAQEQGFDSCAEFRKKTACKSIQTSLANELFGGQIGERRVNTMLCDAFLPAWEIATEHFMCDYWLNWYPGDVPDNLLRFARRANLFTRSEPMSNGLFQGLLGWLIEREAKARQ